MTDESGRVATKRSVEVQKTSHQGRRCGSTSRLALSWRFYGRMALALRIERPGGGREGPGSSSQATMNKLLLLAPLVSIVDPVHS